MRIRYRGDEQAIWDDGFEFGFRSCLDQIALTGLTPTSESAVKEFITAARRRLALNPEGEVDRG
jgi:hypothetical protein